MYDLNKYKDDLLDKFFEFDSKIGHRTYSFSCNVFKLSNWLKNRKRGDEKKKLNEEWVYECGCTATPDAYRTMPYCPIHGLALVLKEK